MPAFARKAVSIAVVLIVCATLGVLVVRPSLSSEQAERLASQYRFTATPLNSAPAGARTQRTVAPSLRNIAAWISASGAAAALTDLRGLGRTADVCLVDPRDDSVTLRAVPGDGTSGYPVVTLAPDGLRHDSTMAPMGCVPVNLDADETTDFLVYYSGRPPVLFVNDGQSAVPRRESFHATELIESREVWNTTTVNVGDIDGDGYADLLVGNYFPDGARILDPTADDDPRISMNDSMSLARNGGRNRILLTKPSGRPHTKPLITDASAALSERAAASWTLATGMQDLTGDGRPEIYQANDFGPDQLLVNHSTPGSVRLTEVKGKRDLITPKSEVLGYDSFKGMGVAFTYRDGNALPTIMVSNITTPFALHETNFAFAPDGSGKELLRGRMPYRERSEKLGIARGGWCWDIKAGDFNNDGDDEIVQANGFLKGTVNRWPIVQELATGNDELLRYPQLWPKFRVGDDLSGKEPNRFWGVGPGGRYYDLAKQVGISFPDNSRALALGDVNGDGRLDMVVANQWEDSMVLLNTAPESGSAADVRLVRPGVTDGASVVAIGAQIELDHPAHPQKAQVYPANGHTGVSSADIHLALPHGDSVPATVTWRDTAGLHTARIQVEPGHRTVLLKPDGTVVLR